MKSPKPLILTLALLTAARAFAGDDITLSDNDRMEHLYRSRIFTPVDVASYDTLNGPPAPGGLNPKEVVKCTFKDLTPAEFNDPLKGSTPKFRCIDNKSGKKLKIRYGADNPEVYSQVVAHNLFAALGLKARKAYRVRVQCDNCPANPWGENPSHPTPRATRMFDYATVEFSTGNHLGENKNQGWDWTSLDEVTPAKGGAPKYEVDAFRLLAAFVYHKDDNEGQQEMICLDQDLLPSGAAGTNAKGCRQPWLMVADLGVTFGGPDTPDFELGEWRTLPVWKDGDSKSCKVNLKDTEGQFKKVKISKAGADFLANLMSRLTQAQIRGLFEGAGVNDWAPHMIKPKAELPGGGRVDYKVDDWVAAFNQRMSQITNHQCQN